MDAPGRSLQGESFVQEVPPVPWKNSELEPDPRRIQPLPNRG